MTTLLWVTFLAFPAQQENGRPQGPYGKPTPKSAWDWEWRSNAEFAYDSNIWLLEDDKQERLRDHSRETVSPDPAGDELNGRYEDMETVDDFIVTPSLRWDGSAPSPFGRRFDLGIGLEAPYYIQNPRRSYLDFDLGIGQAVGSKGHLGLRFEFIPEYFKKNYLAGANEIDGQPVGRTERIYEDGTYQEWDLDLEYRHKLIDRNQNQPFGLTGIVELSYADRNYDSPFDYRDEKAKGIRLGLGFQYGPRVKWGIHYQYVDADSPSETHIVLADPNNIRNDTKVDRTHKEHEVGLSVAVEFSDKLELELIYERLLRDFESDNSEDIEHHGRNDERDTIEPRLVLKISKGWHAHLGYIWRRQESDMDDPNAGDDGDYRRYVVYASIMYRW